jgi:hypothetical protein
VSKTGLTADQIRRGARLLFDKANPDDPNTRTLDRDKWFKDTRDYWERAVQELATALGESSTATCSCGMTATGAAEVVREMVIQHRFCTPYAKENWKSKGDYRYG